MEDRALHHACRQHLLQQSPVADPAHDLLHVERVVRLACDIAKKEGADLKVVIPAAWFHDLVVIPKNDARRSQASRLSAIEAKKFLQNRGYLEPMRAAVGHAIEAHSFSAQITPETIEAQVVQDADRLDGLGAIGIARCFATAGLLNRPFYSENDPFCENRIPNDGEFTIDHFYKKLLKVALTLQTQSGRKEGLRRLRVMENYLVEFKNELKFETE